MSSNVTTPSAWQDALQFFDSPLFAAVQCAGLYSDSKTFADAIPNKPLHEIMESYTWEHTLVGFSLRDFVATHFALPDQPNLQLDQQPDSVTEYIALMWNTLSKPADTGEDFSLISLPFPYVVPGGRFREIYYWDTFFSALGLIHIGKQSLVNNLIRNFLYLQQQVGCIPNGNRAYYRSRSQPPVLSLMKDFVTPENAPLRLEVNEGLLREYTFWMHRHPQDYGSASLRCVKMEDGTVLNRYYDQCASPRPESYREDLHLAAALPDVKKPEFYRHIRAACESGWDFSSRWLADPNRLDSIRTTHILPVDLNCLMYLLETALAESTSCEQAREFCYAAKQRAQAIQRYFWDSEQQFFCDYHFPSQTRTHVLSLAGLLPLFAGIATREQAAVVALRIEQSFLCTGGLVTTLNTSGQQWDAPNGWAPLQWFAVKGLQRYGHHQLANTIMQRFSSMIDDHYQKTGVLLEKYNVVNPDIAVGGGEYEVQLGFGWTNGVYQDFRQLSGE